MTLYRPSLVTRFLRDQRGATASEYALILAVIGVGVGAATLALIGNIADSTEGAERNVAD